MALIKNQINEYFKIQREFFNTHCVTLVALGFIFKFAITNNILALQIWLSIILVASIYHTTYSLCINKKLKELEKLKTEMRELINPNQQFAKLVTAKDKIIYLELGSSLLILADSDKNGTILCKIPALRQKLTDKYGYIIPPVGVRDSEALKPNEFEIFVRGKSVHKQTVDLTKYQQEIEEDILNTFEEILLDNAPKIMSYSDAKKIFNYIKEENEDIAEMLIPTLISGVDLKIILSTLIKERVSVRDISLVFRLLCNHARTTKDPIKLAKLIKTEL